MRHFCNHNPKQSIFRTSFMKCTEVRWTDGETSFVECSRCHYTSHFKLFCHKEATFIWLYIQDILCGYDYSKWWNRGRGPFGEFQMWQEIPIPSIVRNYFINFADLIFIQIVNLNIITKYAYNTGFYAFNIIFCSITFRRKTFIGRQNFMR